MAGGDARKIEIRRKLRRRSTTADEMRLFVVSVAFVGFSRQKVGNVSDANRKTAQSWNKSELKKRNTKLVITCHFGRGIDRIRPVISFDKSHYHKLFIRVYSPLKKGGKSIQIEPIEHFN